MRIFSQAPLAMKPPLWSRRALVAGAIGVAALAGCSSSSSGGGTAGNGSPAAHSVTFHNLTPAENKRVQTVLPLMRGVATNTYQDGDLVVVFKSTATKADQTNVANTVQTAKNAAAAKTASPKSKKK